MYNNENLLEQNLETFNDSYKKFEREVRHEAFTNPYQITDANDAKLYVLCMNLIKSLRDLVNEQNKEIEKLHNEIEQIKTRNESKITFDPDSRV